MNGQNLHAYFLTNLDASLHLHRRAWQFLFLHQEELLRPSSHRPHVQPCKVGEGLRTPFGKILGWAEHLWHAGAGRTVWSRAPEGCRYYFHRRKPQNFDQQSKIFRDHQTFGWSSLCHLAKISQIEKQSDAVGGLYCISSKVSHKNYSKIYPNIDV